MLAGGVAGERSEVYVSWGDAVSVVNFTLIAEGACWYSSDPEKQLEATNIWSTKDWVDSPKSEVSHRDYMLALEVTGKGNYLQKGEDPGSRSCKLSKGVKDRTRSDIFHRHGSEGTIQASLVHLQFNEGSCKIASGALRSTERVNRIECGKKNIGNKILRDVKVLGNNWVMRGIWIKPPEALWLLA
ncbi:hypothetical protein BKA82DRAFT_4020337 [Pisolithus tinctorius]|nr:hypothetical protein BKA82DRAFT_4020337 [Pisolithus tinctorius]